MIACLSYFYCITASIMPHAPMARPSSVHADCQAGSVSTLACPKAGTELACNCTFAPLGINNHIQPQCSSPRPFIFSLLLCKLSVCLEARESSVPCVTPHSTSYRHQEPGAHSGHPQGWHRFTLEEDLCSGSIIRSFLTSLKKKKKSLITRVLLNDLQQQNHNPFSQENVVKVQIHTNRGRNTNIHKLLEMAPGKTQKMNS